MNQKGGAWLAIGIGVGTAIGVSTDHVAVGIGLGSIIGFLLFYLNSKKVER